ncbi:MAG TPA: efflux RND transporter periplasmic adaptor subunit [Asticcacaulis sp.]|nr:efflux RND transporter periplasmic adaptor subunit [Asticcacaulis sp.]
MSKRVLLFAPLCLAALCSLSACDGDKAKADAKGPKGPANVSYIVVETQPLELTQDLAGRTSAYLVSDVRPQVTGIVKARQFSEGGLVAAGQSLYQIDPAQYQAAYDSAMATQQQAQAAYDLAHVQAGRAQQLITIRAISQSDFDSAQADDKRAAATLAQAKAAVEAADINLRYTKVLSPIAGRIGKSSVTPGALVTANQTTALATVQDISKVYVDITQSASDMVKLKQAMMNGTLSAANSAKVELLLDDGTVYAQPGTLEFSDVSVSPTAGTVTLRALFPNPDGLLMPGMFVRARIVKAKVDDAILVPQGAVTLSARGGASVLIAGDDKKAHARQVVAGEMLGPNWRIVSGLQPGDKVIVEGAMRLKDGGAIKASPAKERDPGADGGGGGGHHKDKAAPAGN